MPYLAAAILARIPVNIMDRFIAVFGAYVVSLWYRKWLFPPTSALRHDPAAP
jgi:hypothetical protein